jgi:hypothetical protein
MSKIIFVEIIMNHLLVLGSNRFEVLTDGDRFIGLGKIWIGETLVRSGRLPLFPYTQTFTGLEIAKLQLLSVDETADEIRIKLGADFRPLQVQLMRDHSFDPIHDLSDWDNDTPAGNGKIDLVLRKANDSFNGIQFGGFSYHYEYESQDVTLFYLFDRASWELDGDINGATVVSQSSCSDPLVTFAPDTVWTTEGVIYWAPELYNKNMTHNLPRWASHQAFDFQYKDSRVLMGVFNHVDLIRTTLARNAGKAELKTFDKHIFDQATTYKTSPKMILLNTAQKSDTAIRNVWTWVIDEVHDRARGEFGMKEVPTIPRLSHNYWVKFTIDTYFRDLLPAAINLGFKELFIDNLNKSDMTASIGAANEGNMCSGREYETAPELGGPEKLKIFIDRCKQHGIRAFSWTNNDQSRMSPLQFNPIEYTDDAWFVRMEDTRIRYGGAYTDGFAILDFKREGPRNYWVDCLKKINQESGLNGYLFDSFYNLGFMPVNYQNGKCTTQWREICQAFKELQDGGVEFLIESFGPWGQPQHGCPRSYSIDRCWVVYKVGLGNDYTTIPTGKTYEDPRANDAAALFYAMAHKTAVGAPLFKDGKRLDEVWGDAHRKALADYHAVMNNMKLRYLQEDGLGILWHDKDGKTSTFWNFADRDVKLPGKLFDVTSGTELPISESYTVEASHVYTITGCELPVVVG